MTAWISFSRRFLGPWWLSLQKQGIRCAKDDGVSSYRLRGRLARCSSSTGGGSFEMTCDEREMTRHALAICRSAIDAVDPKTAVRSHLFSQRSGCLMASAGGGRRLVYEKKDFDEAKVFAFGKASSAMALATAEIVSKAMPDLHMSGTVIVKDHHGSEEELTSLPLKYNIHIRSASHPVPDRRGMDASEEIMRACSSAHERTLVLCCISGGGSALFCSPRSPLTLHDIIRTNSALLASGLDIADMNVIRKRLELGKGGRFAMAAHPATLLTLVLSDVIGDPLDIIASGPTVPDTSTWNDAWNIVRDHEGLIGKGGNTPLPHAVLTLLERGAQGYFDDAQSSSDHAVFSTKRQSDDNNGDDGESSLSSMLSETILVGNNPLAVNAAAIEAKRLGYNPVILGTRMEGEAKHVASVYTAMAARLHLQRTKSITPIPPLFPMVSLPAALIGGGETTVTLSNNNGKVGKGGRNQELAMAAALKLRAMKLRNIVLASIGTDGTDGPTDAAGAVVDGGTIDRIEHDNNNDDTISARDAFHNHDCYTFFHRNSTNDYGPLIQTGPTGTNVADVCVILIK